MSRKLRYLLCCCSLPVFGFVAWTLAAPPQARAHAAACICGSRVPCQKGYLCEGACFDPQPGLNGAECVKE